MKAKILLGLNNSKNYFPFYPIVCEQWNKYGFKPIIGFVDDKSNHQFEYESYVFEPVPGVPSQHQSKLNRTCLLKFLDYNDIVIYSDIDMLPLQSNFFDDLVNKVNSDDTKIFCSGADHIAYGRKKSKIYPICYMVAKVKLFLDVFNPNMLNSTELIQSWFDTKVFCNTESPNCSGRFSDETLYRVLFNKWDNFENSVIELDRKWIKVGKGYHADKRVDRECNLFDINKLKNNYYIDAHLPRPLNKYKKEILTLAKYS